MDDHCDAVLMALLNGKTGESYNISANNEVDNHYNRTKNSQDYEQV